MKRILFFILFAIHFSCTCLAQIKQDYEIRKWNYSQTDTNAIQQALKNILNNQLHKKSPDSTLKWAQQLLSESQSSGYDYGIIMSYRLMGFIYKIKGDYRKSLQYYLAAQPYCTNDNKKYLADIHNEIAIIYTYTNKYEQAIDHFYKSVEIAQSEQRTDFKYSLIYNNLIAILYVVGDIEKAIYYLKKGEDAARNEKDTLLLTQILIKHGAALLFEDKTQAYKYLKEAYELSVKTENYINQNSSLRYLAYYFINEGNEHKAKEYMNLSREITEKNKIDLLTLIEDMAHHGNQHMLLNNYKLAEKFLLRSYHLADSIGSEWYQKVSLEFIGSLYEQVGNYAKAYFYQQKLASIYQKLSNEDLHKTINKLEQQHRVAEQEAYEAKHELILSKQQAALRQQNLMLTIGALILVTLSILFILIRSGQRRKIKLQEQEKIMLEQEKSLIRTGMIMEGEEAERKRVAMELHDGIGSMLSMAKLHLSVVRDKYDLSPSTPKDFNELIGLIDQSSQAVRSTAHYLMPEILLHGGLEEGLVLYCKKIESGKNIKIHLDYYGVMPEMQMEQQKMLFRGIQETLQTITNHTTMPLSIMMQLNWQEKVLFVTLDIQYEQQVILNIQNQYLQDAILQLKNRIKLVNGLLEIDQNATNRITIDIEFPL